MLLSSPENGLQTEKLMTVEIKPKSRMVARCFGQIHYVDFSETFAPTPSAASMEIAVAVPNEKG